jgi:hypothetical protein
LLGITCNALVTSLNKGVMPAVGIPANFQPAAPIWNVSGKGQWLTLADQAALYRFSIGDMFLIAGFLMCLLDTVYRLPIIKTMANMAMDETVACGRSVEGSTCRL